MDAETFQLDSSESFKDISPEKQEICWDVANDLLERQKKLKKQTVWLHSALKAALCCILHQRGVFDEDFFKVVGLEKTTDPNSRTKEGRAIKTIAIKTLKSNHPACVRILKILHDLTKPIEARKLEGVDFGIVCDPSDPQSAVYEIYRFRFYFAGENPSFTIRSQANKVIARVRYNSDQTVGYAISVVLKSLAKVMSKLEAIPYTTALSTHAKVKDNFPLNRKRFHHSLPNGDYDFVELESRLPKKLRADGYQDRFSGMDITIESVMVKDEFTTMMNTTALDATVNAEQEVARADNQEDHNLSGIVDDVEGLQLNEEIQTTPKRRSMYGLTVTVSDEEKPMCSPVIKTLVQTPVRSPLSASA
ncbi:hypothetical protein L596_007477 [Steinernema carpocapsae]|uniref:HORMA domain-containing protein n=1 Tax=Steinernema carpocapsae TaxID=34508 RepID=A0A4U5PAF1_STECR|nr:hypothetical protein L596_007477 [Steinernema carpocapsae]